MIRRPPRSTHCISSAASDVYKRQTIFLVKKGTLESFRIQHSIQYQLFSDIFKVFFFKMPKSISCVICCKRVTTACRRPMKGKRNEMQRQNLGALIGKRITENDYICTKCILEHQRGHLQKKLPPPGCSLSPDHDIFYMRGNTDKNCSICN